jgi:hypothetical protein
MSRFFAISKYRSAGGVNDRLRNAAIAHKTTINLFFMQEEIY